MDPATIMALIAALAPLVIELIKNIPAIIKMFQDIFGSMKSSGNLANLQAVLATVK